MRPARFRMVHREGDNYREGDNHREGDNLREGDAPAESRLDLLRFAAFCSAGASHSRVVQSYH